MRSLVEKYRAIRSIDTDYTELLVDTNVFGRGRHLIYDEASHQWLATRMSEAEARLDLEAAAAAIAAGGSVDASSMKLTCDLEDWAFLSRLSPRLPRRLLYVGGGAYPTIALYALDRYPSLHVDCLDIVPHCTVLCQQLADRLGLANRLHASTVDVVDLEPGSLARYDGVFVSSAVRPKNATLDYLLSHKGPGTLLYAREDEAHPLFYEPVTVAHPDLIAARQARAAWANAFGRPFPLPKGCETDG
jgi:hypothetical protein